MRRWQHRNDNTDSTPILPVRDMEAAAEFFRTAGFGVRVYEGGGFAFVDHRGHSVFDLNLAEHITRDTNGAGCYLIVRDVDGWHAELSASRLPVTAPEDMPWGMREFTLTDPDGNHIRVGREI